MELEKHKSEYSQARAETAFLRKVTLVAVGTTALLALSILMDDKQVQTIVTPPEITTEFSVKGDSVSEQWMMMMADRLAYLNLSVTPENVNRNNALFLSYVHPRYYGELKKEFDLQAERVRREQISTFFYPVEFRFKLKAKRVAITGDLHTMIAGRYVDSSRNTYEMAFETVEATNQLNDTDQKGNFRVGSQAVTEFFQTELNNVFKESDDSPGSGS
jgi:type IV conjugative transfer system protein TraE